MADLVCPNCERGDGLWEGVEVTGVGWRNYGDKDGRPQDVEFDSVYSDGSVGCSECAWEGLLRDLKEPTKYGWDGEPIQEVAESQLRLNGE